MVIRSYVCFVIRAGQLPLASTLYSPTLGSVAHCGQCRALFALLTLKNSFDTFFVRKSEIFFVKLHYVTPCTPHVGNEFISFSFSFTFFSSLFSILINPGFIKEDIFINHPDTVNNFPVCSNNFNKI